MTIEAVPQPPVRILEHDNECYTLEEWLALRRISRSTERRMRVRGLGPKLVHLSGSRLGVTVKADREWLAKGGAATVIAEG
jgi:hypothetical protein